MLLRQKSEKNHGLTHSLNQPKAFERGAHVFIFSKQNKPYRHGRAGAVPLPAESDMRRGAASLRLANFQRETHNEL